MIKWIKGLLIIFGIFLILISFPVRYVWGHPMMSDVCRLIGIALGFILSFIRTYENRNRE